MTHDQFFTVGSAGYLTDPDTLATLRRSAASDRSATLTALSALASAGAVTKLKPVVYTGDRNSTLPDLLIADPGAGDVVYLHDDLDGSWLPMMRGNLQGYAPATFTA